MQFLRKNWLLLIAVLAGVVLMLSAALRFHASLREASAPAPGRTIVIDPGHGGEDGGASSADGVLESGVNLSISLRLRDTLRLCGYPTVMIRTRDESIYSAGAQTLSQKKVSDLKNRAAKIAETSGALLVSIHQNFFEDRRYSGAQVFFAPTEGSEQLARLTQTLLCEQLDPSNRRRCKPVAKSVYLMNQIQCTGILVECGFLSNPDESARLQDSSYQKKLAAALAAALTTYLAEEANPNEV